MFDDLIKRQRPKTFRIFCSLEQYNNFYKKPIIMDEQKLKHANQLSKQIDMLKYFISKVENENYRMFTDFNGSSIERFGLDFNEFLPNEGKARSEYLKNLRTKLAKIEKDYAAL